MACVNRDLSPSCSPCAVLLFRFKVISINMLLILSGLGKNTKVRWALQEAVLKLELTGTIDDCVLLIKMTQNIHGLYLCGSHTHVRGTSTTEILAWIAARSYVAVSEKHRHCPIIASNLLARPSPPDVRCHRAGVPFELAGGSTRRRWPLPQRGSMVQLHFNPGGHSLSDSASRWLHRQWKARIWYGLLAIFIYLSFAVLCAYMPFFVHILIIFSVAYSEHRLLFIFAPRPFPLPQCFGTGPGRFLSCFYHLPWGGRRNFGAR